MEEGKAGASIRRTPILFTTTHHHTGISLLSSTPPVIQEDDCAPCPTLNDTGALAVAGKWMGLWGRRGKVVFVLVLSSCLVLLILRIVIAQTWPHGSAPSRNRSLGDELEETLYHLAPIIVAALVYAPSCRFVGGWNADPSLTPDIRLWKRVQSIQYDSHGLRAFTRTLSRPHDVEYDEDYDGDYDGEHEEEEEEEELNSNPAVCACVLGALTCCGLLSCCRRRSPHRHRHNNKVGGRKRGNELTFADVVGLVRKDQAHALGNAVTGVGLGLVTLITTVFTLLGALEDHARDGYASQYPIGLFLIHWTILGLSAQIAFSATVVMMAPVLASPLFVALRVRDMSADIRSRTVADHLVKSTSVLEYELHSLHAFMDIAINKRLYVITAVLGFILFVAFGSSLILVVLLKRFLHLGFILLVFVALAIVGTPYALANAALTSISHAVSEERGELAIVVAQLRRSQPESPLYAAVLDIQHAFDSFLLLTQSLSSSRAKFAELPVTFAALQGLSAAAISIFLFLVPYILSS